MLAKARTFRPRHSTVVAYLALFVALGGSSYAAIKVTGKNVKDGSLTGKDIKNSSLGTADVKNGSLLAGDFGRGQLPAGPQGPRGIPGPAGATGARGPAGATNVTVREATDVTGTGFVTARCLAGERAVGGGGSAEGQNDFIWRSAPAPEVGTPTGWRVDLDDPTAGGTVGKTVAYVVCAAP